MSQMKQGAGTSPGTSAERDGSGPIRGSSFSEEDLRQIHEASRRVLERTGIFVEADDALAVFADGGCAVDRETRTVKIPPEVVESALASAPPSFTLCARDPARDLTTGVGRTTYSNFGEAPMMIDLETGEPRESTLQDSVDIARLGDWASDVDLLQSAVTPRDRDTRVPQALIYEATLHETTKPLLMAPVTRRDARACIDIATAIAGDETALHDRPPLVLGYCTLSPLKLTRDFTEGALVTAEAGLPCWACTMGMTGASAPQTLAGTLVLDNAELVAAITWLQLIQPGLPVWYAASTCAFDLRYGTTPVGSPEAALLNAGLVELARMHRIPSFVAGL